MDVGSFAHHPESLIFALDVDEQLLMESAAGTSRLDTLKQCIFAFAHAKKRACSKHRFGLVVLRERASWYTRGCTDSVDDLIDALYKLPADDCSYNSCDLGSLYTVCAPELAHEESRGSKVRVVLFYGRSATVPVWRDNSECALAVDAIYIHDRVVPNVNCPQQVYNALEDHLDKVSSRAGHTAYIFECTASNTRKLFFNLTFALWHPKQRPPQTQLAQAPVDLGTIVTSAVGSATSSPPRSPQPAVTSVIATTTAPPMPQSGYMYPGVVQPTLVPLNQYPARTQQVYQGNQQGYVSQQSAYTGMPSAQSANVQPPSQPAMGMPATGTSLGGQGYYQQQHYAVPPSTAMGPAQVGPPGNIQALENQMAGVMVGVVVPSPAPPSNHHNHPGYPEQRWQ